MVNLLSISLTASFGADFAGCEALTFPHWEVIHLRNGGLLLRWWWGYSPQQAVFLRAAEGYGNQLGVTLA